MPPVKPAEQAADEPAENAASGTADENENGQQQVENGTVEGDAEQGEEAAAEGNALVEAAAAAQVAPPVRNPVKPFQQRIDELTRNWRGTERELLAAQARIAELERGGQQQEEPGQQQERPTAGTVPAEMVDQLAQTRAEQIAAQNMFDADCNRVFAKGSKDHTDFQDAIATLGSLGGLDRAVIEDALATDAAEEVLYALGKEPEEAMRILKLPRAKRISEFTKMTIKAAPAAKPVSRTTAPVTPVGGTPRKDFDFTDPSTDDAEWHRREDERERAKRRA